MSLSPHIIDSLTKVSAQAWEACANPDGTAFDPFLAHRFLLALEQSGSAIAETGWESVHILVKDEQKNLLGCLPLYLKMHSRGEYVFDQGWAEAYEQAGGRYYPKLLGAVPFTPISGRRLLLKNGDRQSEVAKLLIHSALKLVQKFQLSSLHINFIDQQQLTFFEGSEFLIREGHQFQFENKNFHSFDDFFGFLVIPQT